MKWKTVQKHCSYMCKDKFQVLDLYSKGASIWNERNFHLHSNINTCTPVLIILSNLPSAGSYYG